jgi:iron complex transport system substrate-binding protein
VSLIASATEIVCALGCEDRLVGRSHECDFPPSVQRLPVCTEPKFNVHGRSADIDRSVREIVKEGLSVYRVDGEQLRQLRPDVIITQVQCEVCAVSRKDVEEAVARWVGWRPVIVSLAPYVLDDVWEDIRRVAEALGVAARAAELVARLQERIAQVEARAQATPDRPTVACIEWLEPLMTAGNWMPELVSRAAGVPLFAQPGRHSPYLDWPELVQQDPEVIVVLPCGWDIARTRQDMPLLARRPEWPRLRAVRDGRVFLANGNQFFNRPGPRLVESLEILAELLHPDVFLFGHEGNGWQRFEAPARNEQG